MNGHSAIATLDGLREPASTSVGKSKLTCRHNYSLFPRAPFCALAKWPGIVLAWDAFANDSRILLKNLNISGIRLFLCIYSVSQNEYQRYSHIECMPFFAIERDKKKLLWSLSLIRPFIVVALTAWCRRFRLCDISSFIRRILCEKFACCSYFLARQKTIPKQWNQLMWHIHTPSMGIWTTHERVRYGRGVSAFHRLHDYECGSPTTINHTWNGVTCTARVWHMCFSMWMSPDVA